MSRSASDSFYSTLVPFGNFAGVTEPGHYRPLPDDWSLAVSDVVGSTAAIAAGRYKAVNMAGASVISAILNALQGHHAYPFVFGGDGAMVAIPESARAATGAALAAVQTWVSEDLDLAIRAALVPVAEIRRQGLDVAARGGDPAE